MRLIQYYIITNVLLEYIPQRNLYDSLISHMTHSSVISPFSICFTEQNIFENCYFKYQRQDRDIMDMNYNYNYIYIDKYTFLPLHVCECIHMYIYFWYIVMVKVK